MRSRGVLLLDLPLLVAALGAFLLRFDWIGAARPAFLPLLSAALLVKPVIFLAMGLYARYWSYATVSDLLVVAGGVTTASLVPGLAVSVAAG